uniref:Epidermal patterning factor-like protein n=1 Tax=Davidia involucrata TaxID=16924 RepID=A0A5B6YXJ9_DAVIN
MGVLRRRRHYPNHHRRVLIFAALSALAFLLFASVSAISLNPTRQLGGGGGGGGVVREEAKRVIGRWGIFGRVVVSERRLVGPGSSPPTCRSKCGKCSPCKPVHVPIQPGLSIPLEYYPVAWRCKCGNKLFMP